MVDSRNEVFPELNNLSLAITNSGDFTEYLIFTWIKGSADPPKTYDKRHPLGISKYFLKIKDKNKYTQNQSYVALCYKEKIIDSIKELPKSLKNIMSE
ncbi:MAG: hypothetical protein ACFFD2_17815 [Promethearchaeota archaeon]